MSNQTLTPSQRLAAAICDFFGARPHRFLSVLLLGAALMVVGAIMCYRELSQNLPDSKGGLGAAVGCFFAYLLATVWYLRRVRNGTWQRLWESLRPKGGK